MLIKEEQKPLILEESQDHMDKDRTSLLINQEDEEECIQIPPWVSVKIFN